MRIKKLWLNSLENTRKTLARIIRAYHSGKEEDIQRFRSTVYGMKVLVDCFKLEKEWEVVARIEALEERIENL